MGVTVYVWRFNVFGAVGFGNVGHTSLRVDRASDGESFCLSWWPGGEKASIKNLFTRHSQSHLSPGSYGKKKPTDPMEIINPNAPSDKQWEDGPAHAKYFFNVGGTKGLNETMMFLAHNDLDTGAMVLTTKHKKSVKGGQYSLLHQNCSDVVAAILEAGGAGDYVAKPAMRFVWTPTDVAKWCDHLAIAMNREKPGSAERKRGFTNNDLDFTSFGWEYPSLATCS